MVAPFARQNPDQGPHARPQRDELAQTLGHPLALDCRDLGTAVHDARGVGQLEHLGDREHPDQDRHELHAVVQVANLHRVAQGARNRIGADHRDDQSQDARNQGLDQPPLLGQRNDADQAQNRQQEILGRSELEREDRQQGRRQQKHRRGENAPGKARNHRHLECQSAPALLCQGITFQGRGDGRRGSRRVQQDGGNRTAVHGAAINAAHQDEPGQRFERERHRNEQSHRHGGGQAGHSADNHARHRPDHHRQEDRRRRKGHQCIDNHVYPSVERSRRQVEFQQLDENEVNENQDSGGGRDDRDRTARAHGDHGDG